MAVYALALAQPVPRAYLPQLGSGPTPTVIVRSGMVAILAISPREAPDPASSQQVLLRNETAGVIYLGGWTLHNALRPGLAPYEFPPFELAAGRAIVVISGRGPSRPEEGVFAWGVPAPIWRTGDLAELYAPGGKRVSWLVVPTIPAVPTPTTSPSPTVETSPTVQPSPTSVPTGVVQINDIVLRDPGFPDISEEYVQIRNATENPVTITGWRLANASRPDVPAFIFPPFTLGGGLTITVFTAVGDDDPQNGDFYWDLATDVWQVGQRAELRDASGRLMSFLIVPNQEEGN
jgi:hypothetical protein